MAQAPGQDGMLGAPLVAVSELSQAFITEASPCSDACSVWLTVYRSEVPSRSQFLLYARSWLCAKQSCLPSFSPLSAVLGQFAQ